MEYIKSIPPVILAFVATLFTWGITALGASIVFFFKEIKKNILDAMLGFSAGVMIAAVFWSLISPGLILAEQLSQNSIAVITSGFILGGLLLFVGDKLFYKLYKDTPDNDSKKKSLMLMFSITLHNIPEGLAIGVAFGTISYGLDGASLTAAIMLAIGIGIQNFPEGTAVSVPLRRFGYSAKKSFLYGQLSAIVEPIAGVLGALLAIKLRNILPFLLSFAAGAMLYVVVEELIPESQTNKRKDLMAVFTLIGFAVMMILDVSLG